MYDWGARFVAWSDLWQVAHLNLQPHVEISRRMTSTLGRVFPQRNLIRVNAELEGSGDLLLEVLCHEFAHLVVHTLHGRSVKPHGPEWSALVTRAGYPPRTAVPQRSHSPGLVYLHRCPACHSVKRAKRPVRQWRCLTCHEAGLGGCLEITSHPAGKR
jgi:predicted SprT family Zn-dependent metalloprotease